MNPTVINGYQVAGSDLLALTVDGHDVMHLRYVAPDTEAAPLTPEQIDAINSTVINAMGFATSSPAKAAPDWASEPARMLAVLARAESFIAGFEDDETQEGVAGLLHDLRHYTGGQVEPAPTSAAPRMPLTSDLGLLIRDQIEGRVFDLIDLGGEEPETVGEDYVGFVDVSDASNPIIHTTRGARFVVRIIREG